MRRMVVFVVVGVVVVSVALGLGLGLGLTIGRRSGGIKDTFLKRCQKFKDLNCQNVWDAFQRAYINRDPCTVTTDAYDPFIEAVSFKPQCNRVLFWSKTKEVAHSFTQKRDCLVTLEDTPLGAMVDGLTWCGKKGSNETFSSGCPEYSACENNPMRSYWNRASAALADAACGDVSVMLSGSIQTPFDPESIFATIEVTRLHSPRVRRLNVVLVMEKNAVTNCENKSLKNLQNVLDAGIGYGCKEVTRDQIDKCSSDPEIACGACW
ncbi:ADP-ribosyl cyclase/cyclic ADP-ribose hydrolase 1 [Oryzias latipes]|uniref:ADP-ribosyl cyclase/cyclic ADP-ribose hydrolase n=1 Tax=Oryzias latipes TaxID=8090 RepID=H2MBF4_ORYLA|nr:ADP-ribosyl cyclase/cyclic ADP-ribose hydrolase 1 [Oryzias latipes]